MSCSSLTTGRLRRGGPDRDAIAGRRRAARHRRPGGHRSAPRGRRGARDAEHRSPHRRVAGGGASAGPCPPTTSRPCRFSGAAASQRARHRPQRAASAFVGADLEARLDELGATTLVFCGALAANALEASVRHAGDLGYQVFVVADACQATEAVDVKGRGSPAEGLRALSRANSRGEGATIVDAATALRAASTAKARQRRVAART